MSILNKLTFYYDFMLTPERKRTLLAVFIGITAVFLLTLLLVLPSFQIFEKRKLARSAEQALDGLEKDKQYVLSQARELNEGKTFDISIAERNTDVLVSFATQETRNRGLGGILVADKNGIVLTRTRFVTQRGDFIFHTTAQGRALAKSQEVASIERGAAPPLVVAGGVPLIRGNELFGAIIAAYIIDDDYAKQFRDKYLSSNAEAVFIPKTSAPVSSFGGAETSRLLAAYFPQGSDFLQTDGTVKKFSLNNRAYLVQNIVVHGIEEETANLLVFEPIDNALYASFLAVFIVFILGAVAWILYKRFLKKPGGFRRGFFAFINLAIIFIAIFGVSFYILEREVSPITKLPYLIYNATLELSPDNVTLSRMFEYPITIRALPGGESINVAQVYLNYDPSKIRVVDIVTTNSFCRHDFFIEREIDNKKGEVRIICGLQTPGFSGSEGIVAELLIRPIESGQFSLRFNKEETKILANDGLGTNVLRQSLDGSYFTARALTGDGTILDEANELLIFSPTHPNQERWYNKKEAVFVWQLLNKNENAAYKYIMDENADTIPVDGVIAEKNEVRLDAQKDGVYWFHLLAEYAGERAVSHYRVRIDTTPPENPRILASEDVVKAGEITRLEFSSSDDLSGLQRTFYARFNEIFLPVGPQLFIAFPKKGVHPVRVRAFDNAGNISESIKNIKVE